MITYNRTDCSITLPTDDLIYMFHDTHSTYYSDDYPLALLFDRIKQHHITVNHFSKKVDHELMVENLTITFKSPNDLLQFKLLYGDDEVALYKEVLKL